MKTLTLQEIHAEAKKYDPNSEPLQDAFVAGARFALTGRYYKPADIFAIQDPIIEGENDSFEDWWNMYNKKRGKKKAQDKWNRLSKADQIACLLATPAYVASTPDVQYRLDPLTYLNGERWNDVIYTKKYDEQQQRSEQLAAKAASILSSPN